MKNFFKWLIGRPPAKPDPAKEQVKQKQQALERRLAQIEARLREQ